MRDYNLCLLTEWYGLKPWDVDRLTVPDFLRYVAAIDHKIDEMKREG